MVQQIIYPNPPLSRLTCMWFVTASARKYCSPSGSVSWQKRRKHKGRQRQPPLQRLGNSGPPMGQKPGQKPGPHRDPAARRRARRRRRVPTLMVVNLHSRHNVYSKHSHCDGQRVGRGGHAARFILSHHTKCMWSGFFSQHLGEGGAILICHHHSPEFRAASSFTTNSPPKKRRRQEEGGECHDSR